MNPTMVATRITGSVNMKTVIFPVVSVTMVEHRMQHELPVVQWQHAAIVPPALP